jgi:uroporphyrinogen decarboxylase
MNGRERVEAVLTGRSADTVPVMLHNFMMAAAEAGITMAEFRTDPRLLARSFVEAVEKYGYDAIVVDVDTVALAEAVGVPVDLPESQPARSCKGCLDDLSRVSELEPVDLGSCDRIQVWLEGTRLLKEHFGDEVYLRGNCDQAPFSLASMMRSAQDWMMDLTDDKKHEHAHLLLTYCSDICCQFIELMSETGADMVSSGDSPAGPEMISPAMYQEFAWPYERKLVACAHRKGLPYLLHICGDTCPILSEMIRTGADCLELDHKTNMFEAHRIMKGRVTFVGNIDPSGVLALGDVELVAEKTRELLKLFADTPQLILNAGCAIPASTPSENIFALIRSAREFGYSRV